jgi:hypothetical protein
VIPQRGLFCVYGTNTYRTVPSTSHSGYQTLVAVPGIVLIPSCGGGRRKAAVACGNGRAHQAGTVLAGHKLPHRRRGLQSLSVGEYRGICAQCEEHRVHVQAPERTHPSKQRSTARTRQRAFPATAASHTCKHTALWGCHCATDSNNTRSNSTHTREHTQAHAQQPRPSVTQHSRPPTTATTHTTNSLPRTHLAAIRDIFFSSAAGRSMVAALSRLTLTLPLANSLDWKYDPPSMTQSGTHVSTLV